MNNCLMEHLNWSEGQDDAAYGKTPGVNTKNTRCINLDLIRQAAVNMSTVFQGCTLSPDGVIKYSETHVSCISSKQGQSSNAALRAPRCISKYCFSGLSFYQAQSFQAEFLLTPSTQFSSTVFLRSFPKGSFPKHLNIFL